MRVFLSVVALLVAPLVMAQETVVANHALDWSEGTLTAVLERPVDPNAGADAISRAQRAIERDMPEIMTRLIQDIQLDSAGTIGDALEARERLVAGVVRAAAQAERISASSTADLRHARVVFRVQIYSTLARAFVDHSTPVPMDHILGWSPVDDYTGILIVADEPLPRFAESSDASLEPALFPGFYYTTGSPPLLSRIAEREHIYPETLWSLGSVLYVTSLTDERLNARIGPKPLRLLARGVFGDSPTDVVLGENDARLILNSRELKDHIRSGRVAILLDP